MYRFVPMISAEEISLPKDRRCLRFKCNSFYELNAVNTLPVYDLSAVRQQGTMRDMMGLVNQAEGSFLLIGLIRYRIIYLSEPELRSRIRRGLLKSSDSTPWPGTSSTDGGAGSTPASCGSP